MSACRVGAAALGVLLPGHASDEPGLTGELFVDPLEQSIKDASLWTPAAQQRAMSMLAAM